MSDLNTDWVRVVTAATCEHWVHYQDVPVGSFESKELADKAANAIREIVKQSKCEALDAAEEECDECREVLQELKASINA